MEVPALPAGTRPASPAPEKPGPAAIVHPITQLGQFFLLFGGEDFLHFQSSGQTSLHLIRPELGHLIDEAVDLGCVGLGVFHGCAHVLSKRPHLLELGFSLFGSGLPQLFELGLLLGGQVKKCL